VLARTAENAPTMPAALAALARTHGVELVRTDTAFVEAGMSLGSGSMVALKAPRVVMAWDAGTQPMSAGWTRYTLERRFGQPVTAVRVGSLGRVDFTRVDVLVLPSGTYPAIAGDALRRLKDWINAGGTLITMAEASRWAARDNVGLLATSTELKGGKPEGEASTEKSGDKASDKKEGSASAGPIDFEKAIQPERERPDGTPGALLRVTLDPEHWLSAGTDGEIQAMVEGARIFTPLKLDKGRNVGIYGKGDTLVASGLVWSDTRTQYASKPYLMDQPLGAGHVIAFAEDPNYRALTEASSLLLLKAVLRGPAHGIDDAQRLRRHAGFGPLRGLLDPCLRERPRRAAARRGQPGAAVRHRRLACVRRRGRPRHWRDLARSGFLAGRRRRHSAASRDHRLLDRARGEPRQADVAAPHRRRADRRTPDRVAVHRPLFHGAGRDPVRRPRLLLDRDRSTQAGPA
jgi:hypothetical protein